MVKVEYRDAEPNKPRPGAVAEAREAREERGVKLYEAGKVRVVDEETRSRDSEYTRNITEVVQAIYEVEGSGGKSYRVEYLKERGRFACRCGCADTRQRIRADVQCKHEYAVELAILERNREFRQKYAEEVEGVDIYDLL